MPNPPLPVRSGGPPATWPHLNLYRDVKSALYALPGLFTSPLNIVGINATDLFSLNSALGTAIENSVVDSLNVLRRVWDPAGRYDKYTFVRQSQVFPDVLLRTDDPATTEPIIMGIELKGWFILSKEGEPSFRHKASPNACAPQDLLAVFPWGLSEVISGSPRLFEPFVEEARYAAERRNYYWEFERTTTGTTAKVNLATALPYPQKSAKYNDEPVSDSGRNFGRLARSRVMDEFIERVLSAKVSGVPSKHWISFFEVFSETPSDITIATRLRSIRTKVELELGGVASIEILDRIESDILSLIRGS